MNMLNQAISNLNLSERREHKLRNKLEGVRGTRIQDILGECEGKGDAFVQSKMGELQAEIEKIVPEKGVVREIIADKLFSFRGVFRRLVYFAIICCALFLFYRSCCLFGAYISSKLKQETPVVKEFGQQNFLNPSETKVLQKKLDDANQQVSTLTNQLKTANGEITRISNQNRPTGSSSWASDQDAKKIEHLKKGNAYLMKIVLAIVPQKKSPSVEVQERWDKKLSDGFKILSINQLNAYNAEMKELRKLNQSQGSSNQSQGSSNKSGSSSKNQAPPIDVYLNSVDGT